jgi:hypothetical protein
MIVVGEKTQAQLGAVVYDGLELWGAADGSTQIIWAGTAIQEQGGVFNSNLARASKYGIYLGGPNHSSGVGDTYFSNLVINGISPTGAIFCDAAGLSGQFNIWRATVNPNTGTQTNGIRSRNCNLHVDNLHAESTTTAIENDNFTYLTADTVICGNNCANAVTVDSVGSLLNLRNISTGTATSIVNSFTGTTRTRALASYIANSSVVKSDCWLEDGPLGVWTCSGTVRSALQIADQGTACANGNLALSAGWGSTATVTGAAGTGQTCQFTLTSAGTGQAANATITDTLPTALPTANTVCTAQLIGGTGMAALSGAGLFINQTTFSATAPAFTFPGLPVAGSTYFVVIRCGP